jgi:hypothetical protein
MKILEAKTFLQTRLNPEIVKTYKQYGFSINGLVSSNDWEVFAAILFDEKKKAKGSDLQNYEVKSAGEGSSFEYQYHKNSGFDKIEEDKRVKHLFISYTKEYTNISVRIIEGRQLLQTFNLWKEGLQENYNKGKQRYRKSISHGFVKKHGRLLFEIKENEE